MTSRTTESAARIAGVGLLVLLAFGVLTRITITAERYCNRLSVPWKSQLKQSHSTPRPWT
jgi:hypothetical protein